MKKLFLAALIMCMFLTSISFVSADGGDVEVFKQTIENYDDLIAWKTAGYPDIMGGICASIDFGWPTEETEVDLTGSRGVPMRGASWTIPENITIKNLAVSLTDSAVLNIEGTWINSLSAIPSGGINVISVNNSTLNLAKGVEVYGSVALCADAILSASDAYVENIETYNYSGSTVNPANISGTLSTDLIEFCPDMGINILGNSTVSTERMAGVSTGSLTIKDGGKLYCLGDGNSDLVMSINIESGGEFNWLFTHMSPQNTVTIAEGGVLNTYFGILTGSSYEGGEFRGSGTINLYSSIYGFRYNNGETKKEYWENPNVEAPETLPCLDATIILNRLECDHAGNKAYGLFPYPKRSDDEPDRHYLECSSCLNGIDDSLELCSYKLAYQGTNYSRYKCECGNEYSVERVSGTCGTDLSFELEGDKLSLNGNGTVEDFSPENSLWEEKAAKVKSVVLGKEITGISENAFSACTSLKNVEYDGSYDEWKEIDIKEGNDALLFAEVSFNDGSLLLASSENYGTKTDLLYKEEADASEFNLSIIAESEEMTEENLKDIKVYVAVFNDSGKMTGIDSVDLTVTEGSKRAICTGELPENPFKLMVWGSSCDPIGANVEKN